ncbi:MAG: FHA domain-containing protein [Lachnospiraceae bacterium]|nr:FHA domain-containing protein [Lachnospiraceae bacterium]
MIVKARDRQISFLFQDDDPFLEIGCRILEQEQVEQMLPYARKQQNGKEKLTFYAEHNNVVLLMDMISSLEENTVIDIICETIYLNKKIEENGFLKKECIWYKYDNIYFDSENNHVRVAILPISGELRYADGINWYGHFEETMTNIASYLSKDKAEQLGKLVYMLKIGRIAEEEVLAEIEHWGCGMSETLSVRLVPQQDTILKLLYSGKEGRLEFVVNDEDFLIGRNAELAEGAIPAGISKAVSRKHCLITKMNNKYFVQDLKSVNHTLLNGIMIPPYELMELENNDILSVADIEFRVTEISYDRKPA